MSTYFVARYGQGLHFFYPSENLSSLKYRIWQDGSFSPESTLHTGIKLPFSVFYQEGMLHVFCQDTQGNIMLFTHKDETWAKRTVMQGDESVLLTPMVSEDSLCILYNGFTEKDMPCLFKRALTRSGEWKQGETIDHFKPFSFVPYEAQDTGPGHLILFYQRRADECQVGYREITPKRTGPFHRFLNIQGSLVDASYLTTKDTLHLLMIVKTIFSCQLLYRKKTDDVFTPPILLWEAPRIDNCLLTFIGDELYAACMIGGKLHWAVSGDGGDSFGPMGLYKRKFCAEPVKAAFLSQEADKGWFARHVYVDKAVPWDVQMIPDLCPDFYSKPEKVEESTQLRDLQERLAVAQRALDAKDRQIMELMYRSKMDEGLPERR